LLTRATLCYAAATGDERQRFGAFIQSICADERVIEQWGQDAAAEHAKRWKAFIKLESDPEDAVQAEEERVI
jgi:hypothetical protein